MYSKLEAERLLRTIPSLNEKERLILLSLPEAIQEEAIRRYKVYKAEQQTAEEERKYSYGEEKYI